MPEEIINSESYRDIKREIEQIDGSKTTEVVKEDGPYLRVFTDKESSVTVRTIIDMAIEHEMKLKHHVKVGQTIQQKLETVKKEYNKIRKVNVDKELLGLIIGAKVSFSLTI
jgi:hypothetical protein